mmetsp:Transcript_13250/g.35152  ORF Transcript_13250/g.35152 Transcript_13250/m.35152 type:complete len:510 (-) Transcript_13250:359-1888(-)
MPRKVDTADSSDSDDYEEGDKAANICRTVGVVLVVIGASAIGLWLIMFRASSNPGEHRLLSFNCSDNTSSIDELLACHEKKGARLREEIVDTPAGCAVKMEEFLAFLLSHKRKYYHGESVDVTEFKQRLQNFCDTLKVIDERNAQANLSGLGNPAKHGITKYADWSPDEFHSILGGQGGSWMDSSRRLLSRRLDRFKKLDDAATSSLQASCTSDWSSRGQVRNQGACGDCWTFSTAESMRSALWQQTGQDPGVLSTQYLTDCMTKTSCKGSVNGCCGGNPGEAMTWLMKQGGIPTQEAYGDVYSSEQDAASNADPSSGSAAGPVSEDGNGITYSGNSPDKSFPCKSGIPAAVQLEGGPTVLKTEADMESFVCETGSLSILVDASAWQTYQSGVMDASSCGTKIDHAVLLIGVNQGENAWLVQNSWGVDWGISTSGQQAPTDAYSNCAQLAGTDQRGCKDKLQGGGTVAQSCSASCGDTSSSGGYIWLQFGANTCDITYEAVQVPTLKAV